MFFIVLFIKKTKTKKHLCGDDWENDSTTRCSLDDKENLLLATGTCFTIHYKNLRTGIYIQKQTNEPKRREKTTEYHKLKFALPPNKNVQAKIITYPQSIISLTVLCFQEKKRKKFLNFVNFNLYF